MGKMGEKVGPNNDPYILQHRGPQLLETKGRTPLVLGGGQHEKTLLSPVVVGSSYMFILLV